jgi:hypothetical protein
MESTIHDELRQLEERLLTTSVRNNRELVASLLAEDFVEFGSSGRVFDKRLIIGSITDEQPTERSISDFAVKSLSADVALVTYHVHRTDSSGHFCSLRSSIWQRSSTCWVMRFHQGTQTACDEK